MMIQEMKPLFLPVKKEYFLKFFAGSQDCEIRPNGHRFWHSGQVFPGREVTLSNGYGSSGRMALIVVRTAICSSLAAINIPQWHIEAVEAIYGRRDSWLVAYLDISRREQLFAWFGYRPSEIELSKMEMGNVITLTDSESDELNLDL